MLPFNINFIDVGQDWFTYPAGSSEKTHDWTMASIISAWKLKEKKKTMK